jgi:hypothetical protein
VVGVEDEANLALRALAAAAPQAELADEPPVVAQRRRKSDSANGRSSSRSVSIG